MNQIPPAALESPAADDGEVTFGLPQEVVTEVAEAIEAGDLARAEATARPLHYADLADLIERLAPDSRRTLIECIRPWFDPLVLPELDETVRDEVAEVMGVPALASAIAKLDSDDALYLIEEVEEHKRRQILHAIPKALRDILEEGLTYPEGSAGRLMQREVLAVPAFWTVGDTIDYMREEPDLPDDFYDLYVVDAKHRPIGTIPLSRLLRTKRPIKIAEIMETGSNLVPVTQDQEEVAFLFRQHDLVSAPVVDGGGRLVGVITVDDIVDVIEEEAEEDIMRLAGVGGIDLHAPAPETARHRIRWLVVTLINTLIASTVISRFEATIQQLVALAVLMPIVAAMGGNAGMQVVTVTVRALATRELAPGNFLRLIGKELLVGAMNGVFFAAILGTIAGIWFSSPPIGLVLAAAMIFNMVWAGMAGTLIPLTIHRLGMDPAISAGPFLTTTTDVLGFFSFLGLATWVLL